jgi:tetrahydromethanopterin S-methyltransferase subunit D
MSFWMAVIPAAFLSGCIGWILPDYLPFGQAVILSIAISIFLGVIAVSLIN